MSTLAVGLCRCCHRAVHFLVTHFLRNFTSGILVSDPTRERKQKKKIAQQLGYWREKKMINNIPLALMNSEPIEEQDGIPRI